MFLHDQSLVTGRPKQHDILRRLLEKRLKDGLGWGDELDTLLRGTSPASNLLRESILHLCKESKKEPYETAYMFLEYRFWFCIQPHVFFSPVTFPRWSQANFLGIYFYIFSWGKKHTLWKVLLWLFVIYSVMPPICSTDAQIHSLGWQLSLTEQALGEKMQDKWARVRAWRREIPVAPGSNVAIGKVHKETVTCGLGNCVIVYGSLFLIWNVTLSKSAGSFSRLGWLDIAGEGKIPSLFLFFSFFFSEGSPVYVSSASSPTPLPNVFLKTIGSSIISLYLCSSSLRKYGRCCFCYLCYMNVVSLFCFFWKAIYWSLETLI